MRDTFFVDFLCWLFVIGVFLSWGFSLFLSIKFKKVIDEQREAHGNEMSQLREDYRTDTRDLLDRIMAGSYSEYEAYKEGKPKKPKTSDNFIKRSIDLAEQTYSNERQGYED